MIIEINSGPFLSLADLAERSIRRKMEIQGLPEGMTSKEVYAKMRIMHEVILEQSPINYEWLDKRSGFSKIKLADGTSSTIFTLDRGSKVSGITLAIRPAGLELLEHIILGVCCHHLGCKDVRFNTRIYDASTDAIPPAFVGLGGIGWIRWSKKASIESYRVDERHGICRCPRCHATFSDIVFTKTINGKKLAFGLEGRE
ncbi:MAG: hypothetical protein WCI57_02585 [Candidatus Berkelbacteria bacterium]